MGVWHWTKAAQMEFEFLVEWKPRCCNFAPGDTFRIFAQAQQQHLEMNEIQITSLDVELRCWLLKFQVWTWLITISEKFRSKLKSFRPGPESLFAEFSLLKTATPATESMKERPDLEIHNDPNESQNRSDSGKNSQNRQIWPRWFQL